MTHTHCRIEWRANVTGYEGHGNWFQIEQERSLAEEVTRLNREYPDLSHWIGRTTLPSSEGIAKAVIAAISESSLRLMQPTDQQPQAGRKSNAASAVPKRRASR